MEVGLIGLGRMGTGIAKSLLRAGHRVAVYNRTREKAEALRSEGAVVGDSMAEVCRSEALLTMVADDAALEGLVFGDGGILSSLPRGAMHISLSTIGAAFSDHLTAQHAKAGQAFVAAPVFGRPEAAEAGRLAIVAGGAAAVLQRCKLLFEAMGPKLFVVGERPSMANVVKLAGNFMIAAAIEALAEALALGQKSGVDRSAMVEFFTSTMFTAPVYKVYGDSIVQGKYEPVGFVLPLGLKDLRLVLQAADAGTVPMPIASVLRDRFVTALARGYQEKDWSVIGQVAAEDAGIAGR